MKIQRLYAWSVVLEPMLFFSITDQSVSAIGANVSRILQTIVLMLLITSPVIGKRGLRFPRPLDYRFAYLTIYFILAVVAGFAGILDGVYTAVQNYATTTESAIAVFLNSSVVRPLFEYFIFFYYSVYFAVMPSLIFKKSEDVRYFLKVFFFMFNLSLLAGVVDLIGVASGIGLIPRQLHELISGSTTHPGFRFHGFFGEPRDAFVCLGLGASLYYLRCFVDNVPQKKAYYLLIITCAILTQSASGIAGVAIFAAIGLPILLFRSRHLLLRKMIIVSFIVILVLLAVSYSSRLLWYYEELSPLKTILESGSVPPVLIGVMPNIYPVFYVFEKLSQYNPFPLLLGCGFGSASAMNNIYFAKNISSDWGAVSNPHSNIIRLLAETGIIGILIYIMAFYLPVKRITADLPTKVREEFIFFSLLVLSLTLAHRSAANFIFLGILLASFNTLGSQVENKRRI